MYGIKIRELLIPWVRLNNPQLDTLFCFADTYNVP